MIAQILLFMHIAFGSLALIIGTVAAATRKGSKTHIRTGLVFVVAMGVTAITAFVLSIIRPNPFLFGIACFTAYLVSSGWVWARKKPINTRVKQARMIAFPSIVAAIYMLYTSYNAGSVNLVLLTFGSILALMSLPDALRRKRPKSTVRLHGGRMGGAYIAAFTAFLTVNLDWGLWVWLGPTVVGAPLIYLAQRQFELKRR